MEFEAAWVKWIKECSKHRRGESIRRLEEGHGHAEKLFLEVVWWPTFGSLDYLIPEYEVNDFRDGNRFLDFAYIRGPLRLAIEIDGFGPHWQNINRRKFSDNLLRQNHLQIDGWRILRFSYDDLKERPRMCQQLISQFIGRWFGGTRIFLTDLSIMEKEIVKFGICCDPKLTPQKVCTLLGIEQQKSRKLLHALVEKGILLAGGDGKKRIFSYRVASKVTAEELGI